MRTLLATLVLAALCCPVTALAFDAQGTLTALDGASRAFELTTMGEGVVGSTGVILVDEGGTSFPAVTLEGALLRDGSLLLRGFGRSAEGAAALVVLEAACGLEGGAFACDGTLYGITDDGGTADAVTLRGPAGTGSWRLAYDSLGRGSDEDEEHNVSTSLTHDADFEAWATSFTAAPAGGEGYERNGGGHRIVADHAGGSLFVFGVTEDGLPDLALIVRAGDGGGRLGAQYRGQYLDPTAADGTGFGFVQLTTE